MTIVQVILGHNLSADINKCIDSVKQYASRKKYNYVQINDCESLSYIGKSKFAFRTISEIIRLNVLSTTSNIMTVDWDIYLHQDFDFDCNGVPFFSKEPNECMIYNGNNHNIFSEIKKYAGKVDNLKAGHLYLLPAIYRYMDKNKDFKYSWFDSTKYDHLCYSNFYNEQLLLKGENNVRANDDL